MNGPCEALMSLVETNGPGRVRMKPPAPLIFVALAILAACDRQSPSNWSEATAEAQADLFKAQTDATRAPADRFQVAGKREYPNGTEIYVLDRRSGQVCYYFVANGGGDEDAQKTDLQRCAGRPLAVQ